MTIALHVEDLRKSYGNVEILKGIEFQVEAGEIFGILGPNGAGKSTTLECIEGIKSFNSGAIRIFEHDITKSKEIHKLVGVQLQCTALQQHMTVYEAMKFFCKWQKIDVRTDLLDQFGLNHLYKKQYVHLSTGQKRRLHLALAICHHPKIVILDEPTAGLDIEGRMELHKEIRHLKEQGVTVILASHDMSEVEMLCDRLAVIVKGEIKFIGTPQELKRQGNKERKIKVKTMLNALLDEDRFAHSMIEEKTTDYITLVATDMTKALAEIIEYVHRSQDEIIDMTIEGLSLEEQFMEVVSKEGAVC